MTIRHATDQDIPSIVELLKLSLGESLMPKSEAFWRWKHVDNPFGRSPVLLAFENDQLIGVRAFMRWEWRQGGKIYKSVRAVDTATHPDHQGKGIFKKLTLQLVEQCRSEGVDFIFNTPNKSSKPGYIKMGWMSNGKLKLNIKPFIPWGAKTDDFDSSYSTKNNSINYSTKFEVSTSDLLSTAVSQKFLGWRYSENPNINYYAFSDNKENPTWLTIFRLKPYRLGIEFRICETFQSSKVNIQAYRKQLKQIIQTSGANMVSSAKHTSLFPTLPLSIGPEITTRPLSFDHNFLTFNFWKPALGDMEVF
jgi:GNAT superfamily N-acetyltransferase